MRREEIFQVAWKSFKYLGYPAHSFSKHPPQVHLFTSTLLVQLICPAQSFRRQTAGGNYVNGFQRLQTILYVGKYCTLFNEMTHTSIT